MQEIITIDKVNVLIQDGLSHYFKYVRVDTDTQLPAFRFAENDYISHKDLAGPWRIVGAGFLKIRKEGMLVEGYSMSVNFGPSPDDEEKLSQLLNLPIISRYDC